MSNSLTLRLAEFVLDTDSRHIPPHSRDIAHDAWLDTLGCAIAGLDEPVSRITSDYVIASQAIGASSVWGRGQRQPPAEAAFLNGVLSHALDFDDTTPGQRGHPSTTLVPAALAVGEAVGARLDECVDAYLLGMEVAGKVGAAFGPGHYLGGWHPTGTLGAFGCAAVAGRLLRLSVDEMCAAFGLAATQTAGLTVNFGTMAKPLQAGNGARAGVQAAQLAQRGMTAHKAIFDETPRGFMTSYRAAGEADLAGQLADLGTRWEIDQPGLFFKLWPCCYCLHRPIRALLNLIEQHDLQAQDIAHVQVDFPTGSDLGLVKSLPESGLAGKFSIHYTVAVLLLDRDISLSSYTQETFERVVRSGLMQRVSVRAVDDGITWSASIGHNTVHVRTLSHAYAETVRVTPGGPEDVQGRTTLEQKFRSNVSAALTPTASGQVLSRFRGDGAGTATASGLREMADVLRHAKATHALAQKT